VLWGLAIVTRDKIRDTREKVRDLKIRDLTTELVEARAQIRTNLGLISSHTEIREHQDRQIRALVGDVEALAEDRDKLDFEVVEVHEQLLRLRGMFAAEPSGPLKTAAVPSLSTVLLVEDDDPTRRALARILDHYGFRTTGVATLETAVRAIRDRAGAGRPAFDFAVLDLMLGAGQDGLEVLRQARQLRLDTKVVVATGCDDPEAIERAGKHGAAAILMKPYPLSNLLTLLGVAAEPASPEHE
jgi:CheY-like chemotaxis protein